MFLNTNKFHKKYCMKRKFPMLSALILAIIYSELFNNSCDGINQNCELESRNLSNKFTPSEVSRALEAKK